MEKENLIFGIALSGDEIDECYIEMMKKEHDLTQKEIEKLKMAHLFRLSDNVRFWQFDADIVPFDEERETYYHTGDFEPIGRVKNEDIVALVGENSEVEMV